jgi:hypothetical protein
MQPSQRAVYLSTGGQTLTPAFRSRLELQQASWPSNRRTAAQLPPQLNFTRNIPHHTTNNQNYNTDFFQTTSVTRKYQPHAPIHPHTPQTTHTHTNAVAMDQAKEFLEMPREFVKDGRQFITRCSKRTL